MADEGRFGGPPRDLHGRFCRHTYVVCGDGEWECIEVRTCKRCGRTVDAYNKDHDCSKPEWWEVPRSDCVDSPAARGFRERAHA